MKALSEENGRDAMKCSCANVSALDNWSCCTHVVKKTISKMPF